MKITVAQLGGSGDKTENKSTIARLVDATVNSFAHSMIVDPWGMITARVSELQGYGTAHFDRDYLELVRSRMPLRQQQVLGR